MNDENKNVVDDSELEDITGGKKTNNDKKKKSLYRCQFGPVTVRTKGELLKHMEAFHKGMG